VSPVTTLAAPSTATWSPSIEAGVSQLEFRRRCGEAIRVYAGNHASKLRDPENRSEQRQLVQTAYRLTKQRDVVSESLATVKSVSGTRCLEPLLEQHGVFALASLPMSPARIVVAAATHRPQS
jgi:hypothetical protein